MRELIEGMEMGTNDLYLIKKLKESGVTVQKMTAFSQKLKQACKLVPSDSHLAKALDGGQSQIRPIFFVSKEEFKQATPQDPNLMSDIGDKAIGDGWDEESEISPSPEQVISDLREKQSLL